MNGSEDIDSPSNAIWLCHHHARLVDNNRGAAFPSALLIAYKALHETRVAGQQSGTAIPRGWFHKLELISAPVFQTPASLELGKVTVITGENDTGKTALWQWLAAVGDESTLSRWLQRFGPDPRLNVEVTYFDPLPRKVGYTITNEQTVDYRVDDKMVPTQPYSLRFVIVLDPGDIRGWDRMRDDASRIATILQTDPRVVKKLFPMSMCEGMNIYDLEMRVRGRMSDIYARFQHSKAILRLGQWSSGELSRVVVVLAAALAGFYSTYSPTVLVLDSVAVRMDNPGLISAVQYLSRADLTFQTVIAIPSRQIDYNLLTQAGARVAWTSGKSPNVQIESARYG
jgi:hypothetical protein